MTQLDQILQEPGLKRGRGCFVCGKQVAAAVMVRVQELSESGSIQKGRRNRSRMRSLCADHAAAAYTDMLERLEKGT